MNPKLELLDKKLRHRNWVKKDLQAKEEMNAIDRIASQWERDFWSEFWAARAYLVRNRTPPINREAVQWFNEEKKILQSTARSKLIIREELKS